MTYISGFVVPVSDDQRDAYIASAREAWPLFKEAGALHHVEAWGDKVPEGKLTDFRRAVALKAGETVVFSWVVWPDKETSDRCEESMRTDARWRALSMPFDGARMIFGGFETVFEAKA